MPKIRFVFDIKFPKSGELAVAEMATQWHCTSNAQMHSIPVYQILNPESHVCNTCSYFPDKAVQNWHSTERLKIDSEKVPVKHILCTQNNFLYRANFWPSLFQDAWAEGPIIRTSAPTDHKMAWHFKAKVPMCITPATKAPISIPFVLMMSGFLAKGLIWENCTERPKMN